MLDQEGYQVTSKAKKIIAVRCTSMLEEKDKYFGNAREVRKLIIDVVKQQNLRLSSMKKTAGHNPKLISAVDIENATIDNKQSLYKPSNIGFNQN